MTIRIKLFCIGCLLLVPLCVCGQASHSIRPRWLKTYQSILKNDVGYQLVLVKDDGTSIKALQNGRLNTLSSYLKSSNQIEGEIDWTASTISSDTDFQSSSTHALSFKTKTSIETFNCKLVDDYWERHDGLYRYYALFAVTEPGVLAPIDNFTITTSYASDPVTWGLSLIPGAAQMHKGAYAKGGVIMGGSVALAGGLIALESMRANHLAKIDQTHSADVKKAYNDRASACATGRNICIGALAALYIYNIVDAIVAPGARRIIVTPSVTPDGQYGMGVSYNF